MVVFGGTSGGGGAAPTTDASQLTTGTLGVDRLPPVPENKLDFAVATQAELDGVLATLTAPNSVNTPRIADQAVTYIKLADAARAQLTAEIYALIAANTGTPTTPGTGTPSTLPDAKFAARLVKANAEPVAIILGGSSSVAGEKATAPINRFANLDIVGMQLSNPSQRPSGTSQSLETVTQAIPGGAGGFPTVYTVPGVHGYNIGKSGAKSNDFLLTVDIPALVALNPASWIFQVGGNDAVDGVPPATYKANLIAKVNAIRSAGSQAPIYWLHQYQRPASRNLAYSWATYLTALQEVAGTDPTTMRAIDLSAALPNIPGATDAIALGTGDIDADLIHMTNQGHRKWAAAVFQAIFGKAIPVGTAVTTPVGVVDGAETFTQADNTGLPAGWTQVAGTWNTLNNQAVMTAGTGGLATRAVGMASGQLKFSLVWPSAAGAFVGVRALVNGIGTGASMYAQQDDGTLNLSAIIGGNNTTLNAKVAAPSGTVAGSVISGRFVFNGDQLSGYVNDVQVLTATLTAGQQAALDGTGIGIRQTVAGTTGGSIDNLEWSTTISTPTAPTVPVAVEITETTTPTASTTVASAGTFTYAHTVTAGSTMLVVAIEASASSNFPTASSVSYGGVTMTKSGGALSSNSSTAREASIYTLVNPPVGTANVVVTARGAGGPFTVGSQAMNLKNTAGTFGTPATLVSASVATAAVTTASTSYDEVIVVAAVRSTTTVTGGLSTSRYNALAGSNGAFAVSSGDGGASITATYNWATTGEVAVVALPIIAATGTTTPSVLAVKQGNLPTWEQTRYEVFPQVAAGPDWLRANSSFYYNRGWRSYPNGGAGFGDTAYKASGIIANSAWYHDKTTQVRLNAATGKNEMVIRLGYDAALGKNLTNYVMPDGYTGYNGARVDWIGRSDVIAGYKLVCLWWDASNPDQWIKGEIDFPESNTIGTTFKFYDHDTLGNPSSNVKAVEPILIPGNPTPPRMDVEHLYSLRWTDVEISAWLDNVKVASYTKPANGNGFPTGLMRYGLQFEALDLSGKTPISQTAVGEFTMREIGVWRFNTAIT